MEKIIERMLDGFDCCFCRYSLLIRWVHVVQSMAEAVEKAIACNLMDGKSNLQIDELHKIYDEQL